MGYNVVAASNGGEAFDLSLKRESEGLINEL
jgi:hypothetical protein